MYTITLWIRVQQMPLAQTQSNNSIPPPAPSFTAFSYSGCIYSNPILIPASTLTSKSETHLNINSFHIERLKVDYPKLNCSTKIKVFPKYNSETDINQTLPF